MFFFFNCSDGETATYELIVHDIKDAKTLYVFFATSGAMFFFFVIMPSECELLYRFMSSAKCRSNFNVKTDAWGASGCPANHS